MINDKAWLRMKEVETLYLEKKINSYQQLTLHILLLLENAEETTGTKITYETFKLEVLK